MVNEINRKNFAFRYGIKALQDIDYKVFLNEKDPATKVFAILCNFEEDGYNVAVKNIFHALKIDKDGSLEAKKHFEQLRVLVQLRNIKN